MQKRAIEASGFSVDELLKLNTNEIDFLVLNAERQLANFNRAFGLGHMSWAM